MKISNEETCSGEPAIQSAALNFKTVKRECFHASRVKSAFSVHKARGTGSTFIEMIHIFLSPWGCLLLIWLSWHHVPKLANSSTQTYPDQDFYLRKCLTTALHLTKKLVTDVSAKVKCIMLLCILIRQFINLLPYFSIKKNQRMLL